MSPKERIQVVIDPKQRAALRLIQERNGASISAQIRRAIDGYLYGEQAVVSRKELRALLGGRTDIKAERKRASTRKRS